MLFWNGATVGTGIRARAIEGLGIRMANGPSRACQAGYMAGSEIQCPYSLGALVGAGHHGIVDSVFRAILSSPQ